MSLAKAIPLLLLLLGIAPCGWAQPLGQVIDALTFLGGSRGLNATHIALGPDGDVYVAGLVPGFPSDVFVARLSADLATLGYLKQLGGGDIDEPTGLAVDRDGAAYLAGVTTSSDFPVTPGAWLAQFPGGMNFGGFLVKLDRSGEVAYATLFPESISAAAVDGEGRAVLVGATRNPNFPVTSGALRAVLRPAVCTRSCRPNFFLGGINCFDTQCADAYVARMAADGSGLDYATFWGADPVDPVDPGDLSREPAGDGDDLATAVVIDSNGHIVVAGTTNSTQFPVTPGAYQSALHSDRDVDVFVTKLDSTGRTMLASTLFGSEGAQLDPKLAVDSNGDFHLAAASFDPNLAGLVLDPEGTDALVAKISGDATRLLYVQPVGAGFGVRHRSPALSPLRVAALPGGATLVVSPGPFETTPRRACVQSTYVTRLAAEDGRVEYSAGQPFFGIETAAGADGVAYLAGGSFGTALSAATEGAYQTEPGASTTTVVSRVSAAPANSLRIDCVVNAASRGVWPKNFGGIPPDPHRQDAVVSPGELLTFFGAGLGPGEGAVSDASSGVLPLELGGTRIRIGGEPAALLYAQSSQINAAAPFGFSGSHALLEMERADGASLAFWLPYAPANPGVFTENYTGRGQAVIVHADGTLNSIANPAAAGSLVTFLVTGLGRTALPEASGRINADAQSVLPIPGLRVEVGGIEPGTIEVLTAPGLPAGVYQIRCRVPQQLGPGAHWVTVFVGPEAASQIQAGIVVE